MSKNFLKVLSELRKSLNLEIETAYWYAHKMKEQEDKIIILKEAIAEMECLT